MCVIRLASVTVAPPPLAWQSHATRTQFLDVLDQELEENGLVAILKGRQHHEFLHGVFGRTNLHQVLRHLRLKCTTQPTQARVTMPQPNPNKTKHHTHFQAQTTRRKKTTQVQSIALLIREARALCDQRIKQLARVHDKLRRRKKTLQKNYWAGPKTLNDLPLRDHVT